MLLAGKVDYGVGVFEFERVEGRGLFFEGERSFLIWVVLFFGWDVCFGYGFFF